MTAAEGDVVVVAHTSGRGDLRSYTVKRNDDRGRGRKRRFSCSADQVSDWTDRKQAKVGASF